MFAIDEVTMFEGDNWTEKRYAVAGDILDGYLYDLFMNMLDERGINREFADKLSDYCSGYEHSLYISLLEDLQKFVKWFFSLTKKNIYNAKYVFVFGNFISQIKLFTIITYEFKSFILWYTPVMGFCFLTLEFY